MVIQRKHLLRSHKLFYILLPVPTIIPENYTIMPDMNDRYLQNISFIAEAFRTTDSNSNGSIKLRVLSDVVSAFAGLSEVAEDEVNPSGRRSALKGSIVTPTNLCASVYHANDEVNPSGHRSALKGSISGIMPMNNSAPTNLSATVFEDPTKDISKCSQPFFDHTISRVGATPAKEIHCNDKNYYHDDQQSISLSLPKKLSQVRYESSHGE